MIEREKPKPQRSRRRPSLPTKGEPALIEVFPYGLSLGPEISRPMMIFQDQAGQMKLPIWLGPIAAAVSLAQLEDQTEYIPFGVLSGVLEALSIKLERCVLDQVQGHRQSGVLYFSGSEQLRSLRRPADEIISIGLANRAQFFATSEFAAQSREMNIEIKGVEAHLRAFPAEGRKSHRFLM